MKLSSAAFLEGFYFKPRIDKELLAAHREGLICLSGCVSSELNRTLLAGGEANMEKAVEIAAWFQKLFGNDYYIEVQNNHLEVAAAWRWKGRCRWPIGWASPWSPPATSTTSTARTPRPRTSCSASTRASSAPTRTGCGWRRNEFYLRSAEEMYAAFPGLDDALRHTQEIADSVHIELELGKRHFPVFNAAGGQDARRNISASCAWRA